jgi:hypothetical protein
MDENILGYRTIRAFSPKTRHPALIIRQKPYIGRILSEPAAGNHNSINCSLEGPVDRPQVDRKKR